MGHFGSLQSGVEYPLKPHWHLASSQVNCAHSGGCCSMSSVPGLLGAHFCCISSYLSGFCVVSRSLLQCIFHIWNAHSDIMIRNRHITPCCITLFPDQIFRRGRAMMVVMSRPIGQAISFISHSFFAIFHTSVLC